MLTYALGRELGLGDQKTVTGIVQHMKSNRRTLRSLIHAVVDSPQFKTH
jgi:hypothetical protein